MEKIEIGREIEVRILRVAIIMLLLWDIVATAYILSNPYVEEYSNVGEKNVTVPDNISCEGETIIFGGNMTAPKPKEDEPICDMFYEFSEEEIDLMAACVFFEAGNQSMEGKRLVADVIINRVRSNRFPGTVREVLSADGQFVTWDKICNSHPEDIPIDCYGAVLIEVEAYESGVMLDHQYFGKSMYFFSSDGKKNHFRNGGVKS
jgi:hypothetical protein